MKLVKKFLQEICTSVFRKDTLRMYFNMNMLSAVGTHVIQGGQDVIATSDPQILGGTVCFAGTRVPVSVFFENLADGLSLNQILNTYPTISRDMALRALSFGKDALIASTKRHSFDTYA